MGASFDRVLRTGIRILHKSRNFLCKQRDIETGLSIHILEAGEISQYNVDSIGLQEESDREFLRVALAAASRCDDVYLVTADKAFFDADMESLRERHRRQGG
jgi:hypothetical protein